MAESLGGFSTGDHASSFTDCLTFSDEIVSLYR